jgi:hypothetical protein
VDRSRRIGSTWWIYTSADHCARGLVGLGKVCHSLSYHSRGRGRSCASNENDGSRPSYTLGVSGIIQAQDRRTHLSTLMCRNIEVRRASSSSVPIIAFDPCLHRSCTSCPSYRCRRSRRTRSILVNGARRCMSPSSASTYTVPPARGGDAGRAGMEVTTNHRHGDELQASAYAARTRLTRMRYATKRGD